MDPSNPRDKAELDALGVSVHDISRLNTDFMGHNTFAEVPAVVRQIGAQLALPPQGDDNGQAVIDLSGGDDETSKDSRGSSAEAVETAPSGS
jgi:esterase/lipase superfamily enzyme